MRSNWSYAFELTRNRREFLAAGASLAVLPWVPRVAQGYLQQNPTFAKDPFTCGVASGDPNSDGFVLWTRLAPEPFQGGGLGQQIFPVTWEIASDDSMKRTIAQGTTLATPQLGHSVHVEVEGLTADRWYWYRFRCGDAISPIGRTRTMPLNHAMPDRLRFAFASCQHYEQGLFTAFDHMRREDLDLVLHLGDYIYEYEGKEGKVRKHLGNEIVSLEDYRNRYAQYRSDPMLRDIHAHCPWLVVWDDHEFDNNCAVDISEEKGVDRDAYLERRANAYQAYYENMPLRATSLPQGPDMLLYRRLAFGRLAEFNMLDTRQYRSDQPNDDGNKPLVGDVFNPNATLLGSKQEGWLKSGLLHSQATWNVLGQQIMMARVDRVPGEDKKFSMDQWAGYDVPRRRLLEFIATRRVPNPVVLTGDIHSNWVNDLKIDFDRLESPTVATEFVGTSISSGGNGVAAPKGTEQMLSENPFVKFANAERGYVSCTITPQAWTSDYRVVEYVDRPGAPILSRGKFIVEQGRPGAVRA